MLVSGRSPNSLKVSGEEYVIRRSRSIMPFTPLAPLLLKAGDSSSLLV